MSSAGICTGPAAPVLPSFKPVSGTGAIEKNQEATVYVGNLDDKVTDAVLWDLFTQVGVVVDVHIPCDRVNQNHYGYAFVELQSETDAEYAAKVMNGVKLYGRPLRVNRASSDRRNLDVGANLFVGSLDERVDEAMLLECFRAFGNVLSVKVAREDEGSAGRSRGFGFVSYDDFAASDAAIESMNGQYLCNRPITVNYAFKKDGKAGERHGSAAERLLAAQAKQSGLLSAVTSIVVPPIAGFRPAMPPSGYAMPLPPNMMPPAGYPAPALPVPNMPYPPAMPGMPYPAPMPNMPYPPPMPNMPYPPPMTNMPYPPSMPGMPYPPPMPYPPHMPNMPYPMPQDPSQHAAFYQQQQQHSSQNYPPPS